MRLRECIERLEDVTERVGDGEWSVRLEIRLEGRPFQPLHHEEGLAFRRFSDLVDPDRVLAAEARRRAAFALEARAEDLVVGELARDDLEGDPAIEPLVERLVDRAHRALSDDADNPELASDERSLGERHDGRIALRTRRRRSRILGA